VADFGDERVPFDVLLSTIPLPALIDLCDEVPSEVREARAKLRATHLYYLDVALDTPPRTTFHWAYVPEAKYPFYRVGCYSHFSSDLCPPGTGSLYVELADRTEPVLEAVLPAVAAGLVEMGVIERAEQIRFARVRRIDPAYVIFDHAYYEALSLVRPFLEQARIVSTGRYGGWQYGSMEDALLEGRAGAARALAWLGLTP
jgi:protoporphyrinogen oxidase